MDLIGRYFQPLLKKEGHVKKIVNNATQRDRCFPFKTYGV